MSNDFYVDKLNIDTLVILAHQVIDELRYRLELLQEKEEEEE